MYIKSSKLWSSGKQICLNVMTLLALFVGQRLCINFSISRANFLTTLFLSIQPVNLGGLSR